MEDFRQFARHITVSDSHIEIAEPLAKAYANRALEDAAKVADERRGKLDEIRRDLAPELEATRTYIESAEGVLESVAVAIRALKIAVTP